MPRNPRAGAIGSWPHDISRGGNVRVSARECRIEQVLRHHKIETTSKTAVNEGIWGKSTHDIMELVFLLAAFTVLCFVLSTHS